MMTKEIARLADQKLITKGLTENLCVFTLFAGLPKVCREKIQSYHTSKLPTLVCSDCSYLFYQLSDINTEAGYLCELCVEFFDEFR